MYISDWKTQHNSEDGIAIHANGLRDKLFRKIPNQIQFPRQPFQVYQANKDKKGIVKDLQILEQKCGWFSWWVDHSKLFTTTTVNLQ